MPKNEMPENEAKYTGLLRLMTRDVAIDMVRAASAFARINDRYFQQSPHSSPADSVASLTEPPVLALAASLEVVTQHELDVLQERFLAPNPKHSSCKPSRMPKKDYPTWSHIATKLGITQTAAQERHNSALPKLRRLLTFLQGLDTRAIPAEFYQVGSLNPRMLVAILKMYFDSGLKVKCSRIDLPASPGMEPLPGYQLVRRLKQTPAYDFWVATDPASATVGLKFRSYSDLSWLTDTAGHQLCGEFYTDLQPRPAPVYGLFFASPWVIIRCEPAERTILDELNEWQAGFPTSYMGSPARLHRVIAEIGSLHARSLLVNNISPENLFVSGSDVSDVRIGDYGCVSSLTAELPLDRFVTPYTAPEVLHGKQTLHSDQYSLAMTMYHLRTGRLPFKGLLCNRVNEKPDLSMLTKEQQHIFAKALHPDPSQRWESIFDFGQALMS